MVIVNVGRESLSIGMYFAKLTLRLILLTLVCGFDQCIYAMALKQIRLVK